MFNIKGGPGVRLCCLGIFQVIIIITSGADQECPKEGRGSSNFEEIKALQSVSALSNLISHTENANLYTIIFT